MPGFFFEDLQAAAHLQVRGSRVGRKNIPVSRHCFTTSLKKSIYLRALNQRPCTAF